MTIVQELLDYLFDGKSSALSAEIKEWLRASRRYRAFAETNRSKIRTKLRSVRDDGARQDLRAELECAFVLLHAEQFTLEYEKYLASGRRGPDFTVTFKTHTPFNVEVRRIRRLESDADETNARATKLMMALCEKLGQLPPSIVNLLWLTAHDDLSEADLTGAVATLRQLADRKTDDYFARRGYRSSGEFLKAFHRLSGILLHRANANILWHNPQARHPIPPDLVSALRRLPPAK